MMDFTKYGSSIGDAYAKCADELIINIARHLAKAKSVPTALYEITILSEMGLIKKESINIIKKNVGKTPKEIEKMLRKVVIDVLREDEKKLAKAYPSGPILSMDERIRITTEAFIKQATDSLNLVNQTMLTNTISAFTGTAAQLVALENVQGVLTAESFSTAIGASSRTQSLRRVLSDLSDKGITGFVDSSGRNWSPEAYTNMVIRTTAGNTSTQVVFDRNSDYGNDLISVPIKNASRELCYPWQGKIISTTGRSGEVKDGNGKTHKIFSLFDTSYGQPAGLFGINCGHTPPNIFIPDLSYLRGEVIPKTTNEEQYENSQIQRKLERDIRKDKRELEIAKTIDDKEMIDKKTSKLKADRQKLKDFTAQTGRTYRSDRLITQ